MLIHILVISRAANDVGNDVYGNSGKYIQNYLKLTYYFLPTFFELTFYMSQNIGIFLEKAIWSFKIQSLL